MCYVCLTCRVKSHAVSFLNLVVHIIACTKPAIHVEWHRGENNIHNEFKAAHSGVQGNHNCLLLPMLQVCQPVKVLLCSIPLKQAVCLCSWSHYAQYTPPTPTRLNCWVESRRSRQCVLNSRLVGDSLDESEQFADNKVKLCHVGGVYAPVVSRDPVSNFLCQS